MISRNDHGTVYRARRSAHARAWNALLLSVVLGVAGTGVARAQAPFPEPSQNPIPQFDFGMSRKMFVVELFFNGPTDVRLVSATAMFGTNRTNFGKPAMLDVDLFHHADAVVHSFNEWSPLHIEALGEGQSTDTAPTGTGLFAFPFDPALRNMVVSDVALNAELIDVDLVGPILEFCEANPTEPECGVDLAVVSFEVVVPPPGELLVGESAAVTFHKVITNNGPLGIMDAVVTADTTVTPGSTLSPPSISINQPGLVIDEVRAFDETFTFSCESFSKHPFAVENTIAPANPAFIDPGSGNNAVTVEIAVECVLPVVINIKPGSDPNSINPRSKGRAPVAILSTAAGEYGTPLAFDATRIIPSTVRFGPRTAVFDETGGAFEDHKKNGHVEDAYELDERTRDGDDDLVMHFPTPQTGIVSGDTEACVKGQWLDENAVAHKFFGCDAIRTVP